MVALCRILTPVNTNQQMIVWVPEYAEYETGFAQWLGFLSQLAAQSGNKLQFHAHAKTIQQIKKELLKKRRSAGVEYRTHESLENLLLSPPALDANDMLITISARKGSLSYKNYCENIPKVLNKVYADNNAIIIYPTQLKSGQTGLILGTDDMQIPGIIDQIRLISQPRQLAIRILTKIKYVIREVFNKMSKSS